MKSSRLDFSKMSSGQSDYVRLAYSFVSNNLDVLEKQEGEFKKPIELLEKVPTPDSQERKRLLDYYDHQRQIKASILSLKKIESVLKYDVKTTWNTGIQNYLHTSAPMFGNEKEKAEANQKREGALHSVYLQNIASIRDIIQETLTILNTLSTSGAFNTPAGMVTGQTAIDDINAYIKSQANADNSNEIKADATKVNDKKSASVLGSTGNWSATSSSLSSMSTLGSSLPSTQPQSSSSMASPNNWK